MLKIFYILAWILVALLAVVALLAGYFNSITQVTFSFAVLALVYALALWSVFKTQDARFEMLGRGNEPSSKGGKQ